MNNIKKSSKIHFVVVCLINLFCATILFLRAFEIDNCKSIVVIAIPFPFLIVSNGIIGLILFLFKRQSYKIYQINVLGLIVLFVLGIFLAMEGV